MKTLIALLALLLITGSAYAQQYVNGYTRSNGTYVQGYYRSTPNNTTYDNYSTKGNINPYTGQAGTKNPSSYSNSWSNSNSWGNNNSYGGQSDNNSFTGW